jgi:hypothetical protein
VDFRIIGDIRDVETIAVGRGIRDLKMLRKRYGQVGGASGRELLK